MNKKILVVAAHPDDEILGCGGTIARLVKEGFTAYSLILGEGIASRYTRKKRKKTKKEITQLKRQVEKANKIIGVKRVFFCNFPDNRFDTIPLLDIVKAVEKVKDEIKPIAVFTHYEEDLNIDHQITLRAVITATRPSPDETVKEICSFEIPSSTDWRYPLSFSPDTFFNIEDTLDLKLKAMSTYKQELRNFPHPRSLRGLRINSEYWGIKAGLRCAEAFKNIRKVK